MTDKPTPKEIDDLVYELRQAGKDDAHSLASAVLAKWGAPAGAGEPDFYTACAWYEDGGVGEWIALPGYSNETEHGVKHLVLEAARNEGYKGTAAGRLLELGWEIRPVFLTPQPTHAQAGAVTDAQVLAAVRVVSPGLFRHGLQPLPNDGANTAARMRKEADTVRKMLEAAFSAANGIKGANHDR